MGLEDRELQFFYIAVCIRYRYLAVTILVLEGSAFIAEEHSRVSPRLESSDFPIVESHLVKGKVKLDYRIEHLVEAGEKFGLLIDKD